MLLAYWNSDDEHMVKRKRLNAQVFAFAILCSNIVEVRQQNLHEFCWKIGFLFDGEKIIKIGYKLTKLCLSIKCLYIQQPCHRTMKKRRYITVVRSKYGDYLVRAYRGNMLLRQKIPPPISSNYCHTIQDYRKVAYCHCCVSIYYGNQLAKVCWRKIAALAENCASITSNYQSCHETVKNDNYHCREALNIIMLFSCYQPI